MDSTPILSRQAILQANDLTAETVPTPEWGGAVRVRMLTGTERDAFFAGLVGADGKADLRQYNTRLVAMCLCDEAGNPLFRAEDQAELAALGSKSGTALQRVLKVAQRLNGLNEQAVEDAKGN